MYIYDSVLKNKVEFEPIKKGEARIYVCGPTVYDDAHLGHARSSVAFDLLRRVLKVNGYKVTFVKNFTDIDDKIIKKMESSGKTLEEITSYYIKRYKEEMNALRVEDADIEPKATQTVSQIVTFVSKLIEKGYAYKISDGIYFDTSKDDKYLCISHQVLDESELRARVDEKEEKRSQKDFALWKFKTENPIEPVYEAPFGDGRPGWHIECSCMIKKHIAYEDSPYQIDIHAGGADLLFPHHENEAAQTRCESSQEIAKYWMHNGFVTINNQKMSKSLGNSFFLKDALKKYDGEILRFYLISTHYRANFNFSEEDLLNSKKRLDKIYRLKKRLNTTKSSKEDKEFKKELLEALNDDLNISKALSVIDEMISKANELLDKEPKNKALKQMLNSNINLIQKSIGVGYMDAYEYFRLGVDEELKTKVNALIAKRDSAKKAKDYKRADEIRDELLSLNIKIMDTPNGTEWEAADEQ